MPTQCQRNVTARGSMKRLRIVRQQEMRRLRQLRHALVQRSHRAGPINTANQQRITRITHRHHSAMQHLQAAHGSHRRKHVPIIKMIVIAKHQEPTQRCLH